MIGKCMYKVVKHNTKKFENTNIIFQDDYIWTISVRSKVNHSHLKKNPFHLVPDTRYLKVEQFP